MRLLIALIFIALAGTATANPFPNGNADTGKKLFDKNKCSSCHVAMLGGDGSAIFTRTNRKVGTPQQMLSQMDACSAAAGITLSADEKQHLGAYLNRYYNFK
jgi:cytochrome c peroxidase